MTVAGLFCYSGICGFQEKSPSPLNIGSRLELFVDDYLIGSLANMELRLHSPVDEGPVIYFDKPWEGPFSGYTTIIRDGNKYRMYYRGRPEAGKEGTLISVNLWRVSSDRALVFKNGLKNELPCT